MAVPAKGVVARTANATAPVDDHGHVPPDELQMATARRTGTLRHPHREGGEGRT
jgi:hypothetical protein